MDLQPEVNSSGRIKVLNVVGTRVRQRWWA
jgi:hypothetical protein